MKPLLVALLAFGLSACLTQRTIEWDHPTKSDEEFARDTYECRRDSALVRREESVRIGFACMESKGWRRPR